MTQIFLPWHGLLTPCFQMLVFLKKQVKRLHVVNRVYCATVGWKRFESTLCICSGVARFLNCQFDQQKDKTRLFACDSVCICSDSQLKERISIHSQLWIEFCLRCGCCQLNAHSLIHTDTVLYLASVLGCVYNSKLKGPVRDLIV